jgi:hypothetical protein
LGLDFRWNFLPPLGLLEGGSRTLDSCEKLEGRGLREDREGGCGEIRTVGSRLPVATVLGRGGGDRLTLTS